MKILSGYLKNKLIYFKSNKYIRPITSLLKKKIFNKLYLNKNFLILDLFSGSGSISFEFLSNYCKVISIDKSYYSIYFIKKNIKKMNLNKKHIYYYRIDVIKYLKINKLKYNIIFIDPPYNYPFKNINKILKIIYNKKILKNKGIIILSTINKIIKFNYFYVIKNKFNYIYFFKKI
ncbi:MAG: RsmD family RNA methyltransferase [Candidatus Shikimatogenerans sp. AspAUS03]|uniref:RsmD family RNA methyltransferase n=1 Tax=Candidatus Shikimatogenerans sp. AspAUS03 TaxID=3158563 RepID=A0AAU7QU34_9FLAO